MVLLNGLMMVCITHLCWHSCSNGVTQWLNDGVYYSLVLAFMFEWCYSMVK